MTVDTAAPALGATARNVMDRIRYMVLGTIDEDRCTPHLAGVLRSTRLNDTPGPGPSRASQRSPYASYRMMEERHEQHE